MAKRRRRGVRVRRQVRRLELWPVAKLALALHLACAVVTVGALVVVWLIGRKLGTIDRAATFLQDVGFAKDFEIKGSVLLRGTVTVAAVLVVLNTVVTVVLAFLYNSLSGVMGGLIFSVLEEQPRIRATGRAVRRDHRPPVPAAATEDPLAPTPTGAVDPPPGLAPPPPSTAAEGHQGETEDWLQAAREAR